ncbi:hypothetical protein SDC9_184688 [bioreactor metagenome]|uniref:Uncharacterized protein n=1 Tax=bioreactor metagenome TaxID=1076179 RepID=A0A645HFL1_9ZZZZ
MKTFRLFLRSFIVSGNHGIIYPSETEMRIYYTAPRELAARAKFSAKERGAETRMGNYSMISAEIML